MLPVLKIKIPIRVKPYSVLDWADEQGISLNPDNMTVTDRVENFLHQEMQSAITVPDYFTGINGEWVVPADNKHDFSFTTILFKEERRNHLNQATK